jgi:hypothetical protein
MKYILLSLILLLTACDRPTVPKIAAPQREALEKAKGVNQVVQQQDAEAQKKLSEIDSK